MPNTEGKFTHKLPLDVNNSLNNLLFSLISGAILASVSRATWSEIQSRNFQNLVTEHQQYNFTHKRRKKKCTKVLNRETSLPPKFLGTRNKR